jgi:hypothetical protein
MLPGAGISKDIEELNHSLWHVHLALRVKSTENGRIRPLINAHRNEEDAGLMVKADLAVASKESTDLDEETISDVQVFQ